MAFRLHQKKQMKRTFHGAVSERSFSITARRSWAGTVGAPSPAWGRDAVILAVLIVASVSVATSGAVQPPVEEIVSRSVAAMDADWKAAPKFTYTERDVATKRGDSKTIKTYKVLMIAGSPYDYLTAVHDEPLSAQQRAREDAKKRKEIAKRQDETPAEKQRRIAKYHKERQQDHKMIQEMVHAFDFKLVGEEEVNGRKTWKLEAMPKPGYQPKTHEQKVLAGMRGTLWVDQQTYQWVKVEAQVTHPVSFYGFIAKVGPGTHFLLEQAPVSGDLWEPTHFKMKVDATALGIFNESSSEDETYRDYQPIPGEVAMRDK